MLLFLSVCNFLTCKSVISLLVTFTSLLVLVFFLNFITLTCNKVYFSIDLLILFYCELFFFFFIKASLFLIELLIHVYSIPIDILRSFLGLLYVPYFGENRYKSISVITHTTININHSEQQKNENCSIVITYCITLMGIYNYYECI